MRTISAQQITDTVARLCIEANTRLPRDIVVVKATQVPDSFNAIGSCLKKEYTYRIYNSHIRNAFYVNRAWFYPKHLDETVMQRAASHFVGTHDFAAVRSVGTETRTTVRTVHYLIFSRSRRTDRVPGCAPTAFSTTWCAPWWALVSTPPTANSPR